MTAIQFQIEYNKETKKIKINEGLYESNWIESIRNNHFNQPIFDLKLLDFDDNDWCSITINKKTFNLFLRHFNLYYKTFSLNNEDENIVIFKDFLEVKKIEDKWVNIDN